MTLKTTQPECYSLSETSQLTKNIGKFGGVAFMCGITNSSNIHHGQMAINALLLTHIQSIQKQIHKHAHTHMLAVSYRCYEQMLACVCYVGMKHGHVEMIQVCFRQRTRSSPLVHVVKLIGKKSHSCFILELSEAL